jgi:hypothetical protein
MVRLLYFRATILDDTGTPQPDSPHNGFGVTAWDQDGDAEFTDFGFPSWDALLTAYPPTLPALLTTLPEPLQDACYAEGLDAPFGTFDAAAVQATLD